MSATVSARSMAAISNALCLSILSWIARHRLGNLRNRLLASTNPNSMAT